MDKNTLHEDINIIKRQTNYTAEEIEELLKTKNTYDILKDYMKEQQEKLNKNVELIKISNEKKNTSNQYKYKELGNFMDNINLNKKK